MNKNSTAAAFIRLPQNTHGRDFVVGDIHGAFGAVAAAMAHVGFDGEVDRLFCVGDLIDRGTQSAMAGEFLRQRGVYAVRGNHEQNYIEIFRDGDPDPETLNFFIGRFQMEWLHGTTAAQRVDLLAQFQQLPLAMEIETARGLVGIVHADVPEAMDWPTFRGAIERGGDEEVIRVALEGRRRVNAGNDSGVPGIGRVFVGHTPQFDGAKRLGNVYYVDSGAVFAEMPGINKGHLTVSDLVFSTQEIVTKPTPATGGLRLLDAEPPAGASFGNYARKVSA